MTYDNTNRWVLFKNDRKEKETQPDMTGNINVDGKEFWLSAWTKQSEKWTKFLSISIKEKDATESKASDDLDVTSDLPF